MKNLFTGLLLLLTAMLFAQPVNDDCAGLVHLGIAPSCETTLYNNVGATASDIGTDNIPPCWPNNPERDVWIAFEASDTITDYLLTITGSPDLGLGLGAMLQPEVAVYRGECEMNGLVLFTCATSGVGESFLELELAGLTAGQNYFVRIQDWSGTAIPNQGAFQFCIIEKPPVNNICDGGSTMVSGTLSDSGGPDGDYANNENCIYTICPDLPHECLTFDLQYYNIDYAGDELNFYDGSDTSGELILSVSGPVVQGEVGASNSGVCQTVNATSGCMTVEFISDANLTFEGFLGSWGISSSPCEEPAEITVDISPSKPAIVQSIIGGNSLISLSDIDCPNGAMGIFDGTGTDLGLDKGMLLTTGNAIDVANPASFFNFDSENFADGDEDLDYLSLNYSVEYHDSYDACIVELDVLANSEKITFEYIFGSEEYPEYFEEAQFNDVFGLLASGPGLPIAGSPSVNNQQNVGVLSDGSFIEIASVNFQNNWQYYRDNLNGQSVAFDGLTSDSLGIKKSLTATVPTMPCETYHLKLAIADRRDQGYDSGVFISKITSGIPEIAVNFSSGLNYLSEACTPSAEELVISLDSEITQPTTVQIQIEGTAELGVDYELNAPSSVEFVTGNEVYTYDLLPLMDGIVEGEESIIISLVQDFGCGDTTISSLEISIFDNIEVDILGDVQDTIIICATGTGHQLEATGAENYLWAPAAIFSDPTIADPIALPTSSQWVTVTGTSDLCTDTDSVFLEVVNPEITILPGTIIDLCEDSVTLTAVNNVNNSNLEWEPFFFLPLDDPNNPVQTIYPEEGLNSLTLEVRVELDGCVAEETVQINLDLVEMPELANDTTICQNYSVDLGEDITTGTTFYSWTPNIALSPGPNVSGPIATPDQTTTYRLIGTGAQEVCSDTAEVTITVIPSDVEIQNPDTTFICVGDSVDLVSVTSTGGTGLTWSPDLFLSPNTSSEIVTVNPPVTTWYYATLEATPQCTVFDSVLVWVDSIPNLEIMAEPMKDSYCQGEEILLTSPTYEPANFPDIDFTWEEPMPGSQTPDSFLNLVLIAQVDNIFIRTSTVNACVSVDTFILEVVEVNDLVINPAESTICQGESVQLNAESDILEEITEFTWTPSNGLSCTDCPDPVASPNGTTNYQLEVEYDGCPFGAAATVIISAELFNGSDGFICPGESYQLNNVNVPDATFSWTSSDGTFTSDEANPVVSPAVTTTYNLVATSGDCTVEGSVTVTVQGPFTVMIDDLGIQCPRDTIIVNATGSVEGLNYTWFGEAGDVIQTGNPLILLPGSTTQVVFVEAFDGCTTESASSLVEVSPDFTLDANASPESVTAGTEVTLSAITTGGVGLTYSWNVGSEEFSTDQTTVVTPCQTTTYTVIVTDENECPQSENVQVIVSAGFSIDSLGILLVSSDSLSVDDPGNIGDTPSIFEGQEFQIIAWSTPQPVPGATYEWQFDGSVFSSNQDTISGIYNAPEVAFDSTFQDGYGVFIIDPTGCEDFLDLDIIILDNPVRLPNVFTPNGDQVNDFFNPVSKVPVTITEFKVWNRWGQLVYDNDTPETGWDGFQDGEPAVSDVFVYRIIWEITGGTGTKMVEKGDVTLIR